MCAERRASSRLYQDPTRAGELVELDENLCTAIHAERWQAPAAGATLA
jgi:hypothetical protein